MVLLGNITTGSRAKTRSLGKATAVLSVGAWDRGATNYTTVDPNHHSRLTSGNCSMQRQYFQHPDFISIVGVGKRGAY